MTTPLQRWQAATLPPAALAAKARREQARAARRDYLALLLAPSAAIAARRVADAGRQEPGVDVSRVAGA